MSISSGTLMSTFLGALQGTISILLTLIAGYIMARRGYLTRQTVRHVSKLCTILFLPCLIVEKMGPELTMRNLSTVWIIPLWGLASNLLAHGIGYVGKRLMRLPYWTIAACGRPNSNALPLLLIQSLEHTGVIDMLAKPGEPIAETLSRAKSLILLNAVVQESLTFQLAPSIMARDDGHKDDDPESQNRLRPGSGKLTAIVQDPEHVGLLDDNDRDDDEEAEGSGGYRSALEDIADQPDVHWPKSLSAVEKPLKAIFTNISAPAMAAIIALIIGITPPLHHAIFDEDSVLYSSVTQSIQNLGELFVVLQTFTVGAELALVGSSSIGCLATSWILFVRFVIMPAIGILFVWATAGRGLYVDDQLVWFLLVLIPSGPSAMLLVNVAELVDISQGAIAGYLTVAYLFSPLMAVICSLGLSVVKVASGRIPS